MRDNFRACLAETLRWEGGWADHPKDPGGATMKGITLATYRQYRPGATKAQLRAISDAEVQAIYQRGYWNPVRGEDLPAGVDLAVFDGAVNSGPRQASLWLQRAVGAVADGVVGPKTVAAAAKRSAAEAIKSICKQRLSMYQGLKGWATFGKGWTNRIVAIEAVGLKMAGANLAAEAEQAAAESDKHKAEGVGTAGAGGLGVISMDQASMPEVLIVVLIVATAAFALWRAREARIDEKRAEAIKHEAGI